MSHFRPSIAGLLTAFLLGGLIPRALGQKTGEPGTVLNVQIGWGDKVRPGRWTPVFVQVADPTPRNAMIEINAPQGGMYAMQVRQYIAIGPIPSTFTLFVPLQASWGAGPTVIIRSEGGKTLARYPEDPENETLYQHNVDTNAHFIGVSGRQTQLTVLQGQIGAKLGESLGAQSGTPLQVGFLDPELLPTSAFGYNGLDLLVLNQPDLLHLRGEQQQAIVEWVRGGGNLILWPGEDLAPTTGPLIDALPCTIAGLRTAAFSDSDLLRLGLPHRFAGMRGRKLLPRDDKSIHAEPVDLFGGPALPDNTAYRRQLGLGSILVAPINLSELQFDNSDYASQFWLPLLTGTSIAHVPGDDGIRYNNVDPYTGRQYSASQALEDFLGNVPGAGKFGFSYVAMVLLGMMILVGPVDWYVLRRLGRQPWTWVTTAGWIALITGGALFIGHMFKSGTLYYRSVRVIDQADGNAVGETSLVGIYSPRTTDYHLDAVRPGPSSSSGQNLHAPALPPPGWWTAVSTDQYWSRHGIANDIAFHQTDEGNAPEPMLINVWNLRFLQEESTSAGPPLVEANLRFDQTASNGDVYLKGTIKNLTDKPMVNVRIRTKDGVTSPTPRIEPSATVEMNARVDTSQKDLFSDNAQASLLYNYGNGGNPVMPADNLWHIAGNLSAIRTRRVEALLATDRYACIYAECPEATPPATLREAVEGTQQQYYEILRAVVPISRGTVVPPPTPDSQQP